MPSAAQHEAEENLFDKVDSAVTLIESGHESRSEWNFIRALNNHLINKKQSCELSIEEESILELIVPVINKYGNLDPKGVEQDPTLANKRD